MMTQTLSVHWREIERGQAVSGSRRAAMARLKSHGSVLWLRARGCATLFYIENGTRRQHTWERFRLIGAVPR